MQVDTKDILYMLAKEFKLGREDTKKRLILQKTIYLLQAYGLKLGYGFSWYKYGPYSQDLVQDAYEVLYSRKDHYNDETEKLTFDESCIEKFERFKQLLKDDLGNDEELELIASVDFARQTWYQDETDKDFISKFKNHKRYLYGKTEVNDEMVKEALGVVKKLRAKN